MVVRSLRWIVALLTFFLAWATIPTADAASTFTVTDLGNSYTLQQDATGTVQTVTSGDGSQTYAFAKSPVTYNPNPGGVGWSYQAGTGSDAFQTAQGLQYQLIVASNQAGSIGYHVYDHGSYTSPTAISLDVTGVAWSTPLGDIPVRDLNSSGEVVGTTLNLGNNGVPVTIPGQQFAATFTGNNFVSHEAPYLDSADPRALTADNLNNYIASDLGVFLSVGLKVDDLGDIIAQGTLNGQNQYFLLSPNGPPTPAPEPATLVSLVFGLTALGLYSGLRRRVSHPPTA